MTEEEMLKRSQVVALQLNNIISEEPDPLVRLNAICMAAMAVLAFASVDEAALRRNVATLTKNLADNVSEVIKLRDEVLAAERPR